MLRILSKKPAHGAGHVITKALVCVLALTLLLAPVTPWCSTSVAADASGVNAVGTVTGVFDKSVLYTIKNGYGSGYVLGYPGLGNGGDIHYIGVTNSVTHVEYAAFMAYNGIGSFAGESGLGCEGYVVSDGHNENEFLDMKKAYQYIEANYGKLMDNRALTQAVTWVLQGYIDINSAAFDAIEDWKLDKAAVKDVMANYQDLSSRHSSDVVEVLFMVCEKHHEYSQCRPLFVPIYEAKATITCTKELAGDDSAPTKGFTFNAVQVAEFGSEIFAGPLNSSVSGFSKGSFAIDISGLRGGTYYFMISEAPNDDSTDTAWDYSTEKFWVKITIGALTDSGAGQISCPPGQDDIIFTNTYTDPNLCTVIFKPGNHGTFEEVSYRVAFDENTPGAPDTPGEEGWVFKGWSPELLDKATGDMTYVAQWEEIPYVPPVDDTTSEPPQSPEQSPDPSPEPEPEQSPELPSPPPDSDELPEQTVAEPPISTPDVYVPGGSDPFVPPAPSERGNELVEQVDDDGNIYYMEFGDDGTPLGEWHYDTELSEWLFEEYAPPLSNMPDTGISSPAGLLLAALLLSLAGVYVMTVLFKRTRVIHG